MRAAQKAPVSPALLRHLQERSKRRENRVADQITRFAGSMTFVYIHAIWFGLWIGESHRVLWRLSFQEG